MLLASHYVLNKTARVDEHVVYPYVHSSSCWRTAEDMLRPVKVPDVRPSDLPSHVDFSMVAGEFVEVYLKEQERGMWNAVATCYFIDTAHNFIRYLEVINHVLPLGGVWVNVGPLLWHFEGSTQSVETGPSGLSIELTLDEVISLIELMGFTVEVSNKLHVHKLVRAYLEADESIASYVWTIETKDLAETVVYWPSRFNASVRIFARVLGSAQDV